MPRSPPTRTASSPCATGLCSATRHVPLVVFATGVLNREEMKPSPYRTAAKIAWRETRASSGRFIFVILAVAAGVGSLTGVQGFSRAFHTMLQRDARTFMAADLTVRTFQLPTDEQNAAMNRLK